MTRRRLTLLGGLTVIVVFAACDLNPQPLPPVDTQATADGGAFGSKADASRGDEPPAPLETLDAAAGAGDGSDGSDGAPPPDDDDAGDAGDAGDGGDAEAT